LDCLLWTGHNSLQILIVELKVDSLEVSWLVGEIALELADESLMLSLSLFSVGIKLTSCSVLMKVTLKWFSSI
jgi:hypothetical protein